MKTAELADVGPALAAGTLCIPVRSHLRAVFVARRRAEVETVMYGVAFAAGNPTEFSEVISSPRAGARSWLTGRLR
jgi:hypothetical protein